jgi:hypothetical protein
LAVAVALTAATCDLDGTNGGDPTPPSTTKTEVRAWLSAPERTLTFPDVSNDTYPMDETTLGTFLSIVEEIFPNEIIEGKTVAQAGQMVADKYGVNNNTTTNIAKATSNRSEFLASSNTKTKNIS